MKKFKFLAAFVAFASFLGLTSCSDDQAELLNGGQGPAGSTILNVNYTIPGDSTKVFVATSMNATANDSNIVITAENEDTGESLEISFTGNKVQDSLQASYVATVTYIDATGNEYSSMSPFTNKHTGAVRLKEINTTEKRITGVFSFIGYDDNASTPSDGVPFFSGVFMSIPYTGTLPEANPTPGGEYYMKATIDFVQVNFADVSTITNEDGTIYKGENTTPMYTITLAFPDNSIIAAQTSYTMGEEVIGQISDGTTTYSDVDGFVMINTISPDGKIHGAFAFTADTGTGEDILVSNGEFILPVE